jgi:beta-galactosidase GanA
MLEIAKEYGIKRLSIKVENDVEVIKRDYMERDLYCIFNFSRESVQLDVPCEYSDILTENKIMGSLSIEPRGCAFIVEGI